MIWDLLHSLTQTRREDISGTHPSLLCVPGEAVDPPGQRGGSLHDHGDHWPARSTPKPR